MSHRRNNSLHISRQPPAAAGPSNGYGYTRDGPRIAPQGPSYQGSQEPASYGNTVTPQVQSQTHSEGPGKARSGSQRRRQSPLNLPEGDSPFGMPPTVPDAPSAPKPGPPLSYRDPFYGTARGPPIAPPVDPPVPHVPSKNSGSRRRSSVSDRSPLQKLEVKLDDISKEEKRARILEAELAAQEKQAIARATQQSVQTATAGNKPQKPSTATSEFATGPNERRHVSAPMNYKSGQQSTQRNSVNYEPRPERASSTRQAQTTYHGDPNNSVFHRSHKSTTSQGLSRGPSYREREAKVRSRRDSDNLRRSVDLGANEQSGPGLGLGLTGINKPDASNKRAVFNGNMPPQSSDPVNVSNKYGNQDKYDGAAGKRAREGIPDRKTNGQSGAEPPLRDPLPPQAVINRTTPGSRYDIPPQSAGAQFARDQVGFGTRDPEQPVDTNRHTHQRFTHAFHRHRDPERRYKAPQSLDEWKEAGTASLRGDDLDLNSEDYKTWWESGGSQKQRRRSSARPKVPTTTQDGTIDVENGETMFSPRLFLKCGPLLRFTGIKSEPAGTGLGRDIWRGSVMIVTLDDMSSYQTAPTLRLFKQPVDLLPPPPGRIDAQSGQLDPAYVDPLAGQIKMSRSGKTLYVKAVDSLEEQEDLSRIEDDSGLFEVRRSTSLHGGKEKATNAATKPDGEKIGKYREVKGVRLHVERGFTFWRFNLEIELGSQQTRVAYRINGGPAIGFWVPARGQSMNIMFHSCNGFSLSVNPHEFCGPDPLWRDVLNNHQTRPFHVMIGGGDQIYNDAAMKQTHLFQEWTSLKNPAQKHSAPFTAEMQDELEDFYLNRYAMWFSQGLFGMAASQIPMVNIWDDHDIIDGFGSYPHHFMSTPVFTGLGAVAYKYYMLFQHQSVSDESEREEPSWLLGASPGPYINQLSRSVFMSLGGNIAFLGLDCRTERTNDMVLSDGTYGLIFSRLRGEIVKGKVKHLIVLLGVPIAYPRYNFLENILTSRLMYPIKAAGRMGLLGNIVNKFDGGVEILDDLDDHWTARHHKQERNYFIEDLQEFAADKSVRVTILGGDVHLAGVGQFFSNKNLRIPKDRDHRYMPNVISSAIVNTPPPDMVADVLNKRNKIHHLNAQTDEDMIPMFMNDVDGKSRNNNHLLPRRNWCSIREYQPGSTPPPTPPSLSPTPPSNMQDREEYPPGKLKRTLSDHLPASLGKRLSVRGSHPPTAFETQGHAPGRRNSLIGGLQRRLSNGASSMQRRLSTSGTPFREKNSTGSAPALATQQRPNPFHRRPTGLSEKAALRNDDPDLRQGHIDLQHGLDIVINAEVNQKDPAGITTPYRLLVPALDYRGPAMKARDDGGSVLSYEPSEPGQRRPSAAGIFVSNMAQRVRRMSTVARRKPDMAKYDTDRNESAEGVPARPIIGPPVLQTAQAPDSSPSRTTVPDPLRSVPVSTGELEHRGSVKQKSLVPFSGTSPADVRRKSLPTRSAGAQVQHSQPVASKPLEYQGGGRIREPEPLTDVPPPRPLPAKLVKMGLQDDRTGDQMGATFHPTGDTTFERGMEYGYAEDYEDDDESMLTEELEAVPKRKDWKSFWKR